MKCFKIVCKKNIMYYFNCIIILINVNLVFFIYVIEEIYVVLEKKFNVNWVEDEIFIIEIIFLNI